SAPWERRCCAGNGGNVFTAHYGNSDGTASRGSGSCIRGVQATVPRAPGPSRPTTPAIGAGTSGFRSASADPPDNRRQITSPLPPRGKTAGWRTWADLADRAARPIQGGTNAKRNTAGRRKGPQP